MNAKTPKTVFENQGIVPSSPKISGDSAPRIFYRLGAFSPCSKAFNNTSDSRSGRANSNGRSSNAGRIELGRVDVKNGKCTRHRKLANERQILGSINHALVASGQDIRLAQAIVF